MRLKEDRIQELVKDAFALIKEETVLDFMKEDKKYCASSCEREEAEQLYIQTINKLGEKEREIVEQYLEAIDRNNGDTCDLYYLAGVSDAIRFLCSYGMVGEKRN